MLTDIRIRAAEPKRGKTTRLYDSRGLYLEVAPSGGKWWRLKYRFADKEKRISLGTFPNVGLKGARTRCDEARKQLANGIDPSQQRMDEKAASTDRRAHTFEALAREWYGKNSEAWAPDHAKRVLRLFERDIFPLIGQRPIADIEAPELLTILRRIEARGVRMTTHRARVYSGKVFLYAIAVGNCKRNPAADLRGALAPMPKSNFAAVTEPKQFGDLLRTIYGYQGTFTVRCALRLAPLLVVRPGELRKAEWKDFDLDAAGWRFTVSKTDTDHLVPLSGQALEILRELKPLTGNGRYVFPSARSAQRPMSDNAVLAALRRMEIPAEVASGHGFRASFRTIGAEHLGFRIDLMEHQLAHAVRDALGTAYNRTQFLRERRILMQKWSDYCFALKDGGEILTMPKRA